MKPAIIISMNFKDQEVVKEMTTFTNSNKGTKLTLNSKGEEPLSPYKPHITDAFAQ